MRKMKKGVDEKLAEKQNLTKMLRSDLEREMKDNMKTTANTINDLNETKKELEYLNKQAIEDTKQLNIKIKKTKDDQKNNKNKKN